MSERASHIRLSRVFMGGSSAWTRRLRRRRSPTRQDIDSSPLARATAPRDDEVSSLAGRRVARMNGAGNKILVLDLRDGAPPPTPQEARAIHRAPGPRLRSDDGADRPARRRTR